MNSKTIIKYLGIFFWVAMLGIFIYIAVKFTFIKHEVDIIVSTYGYIGIFAIAFLSDILMQPIGPDIPMIGGILIGANVYYALVAACLGTYLASLLSFKLGKVYGKWGFDKLYNEKVYKRAHRVFEKYGRAGLAIAALTPVPYVPLCWLTGMFKMKLKDFIIFGLAARTLRLIGVAFIVWLITV